MLLLLLGESVLEADLALIRSDEKLLCRRDVLLVGLCLLLSGEYSLALDGLLYRLSLCSPLLDLPLPLGDRD